MSFSRPGFTVVELIIIISVIGLLAVVGVIGYTGWQYRSSLNSVKSDMRQAISGLESYKNFNDDYPPNLAGVGFAASDNVALTLRTNAPQLRTYEGLTSAQNAQLFLNSCNANMPIVVGGTTYNTACTFAGNNIHISGTNGSNTVIHGPSISSNDIQLVCGSVCDSVAAQMISEFTSQNGTFPLTVPRQQSALPEPTLTTYGSASEYCLEGRSSTSTDIIFHHSNSDSDIESGACPNDPELHYP